MIYLKTKINQFKINTLRNLKYLFVFLVYKRYGAGLTNVAGLKPSVVLYLGICSCIYENLNLRGFF